MGDIRHQPLQLLPFRIHLPPVLLHDPIQPGQTVADTGKERFTVPSAHRLSASADHLIHCPAQLPGKYGKPFAKGNRQKEHPRKGAEHQEHATGQYPHLACHREENRADGQHGNRHTAVNQQEYPFYRDPPQIHFLSPPIH